MRQSRQVALAVSVMLGSTLTPDAGGLAAKPIPVSLPADFQPRFLTVCQRRGLSEARCLCMADVVLREVADDHLALMITYLENPQALDSRPMQELDNDENRMQLLADEIAAAQATARAECQQF